MPAVLATMCGRYRWLLTDREKLERQEVNRWTLADHCSCGGRKAADLSPVVAVVAVASATLLPLSDAFSCPALFVPATRHFRDS